MRSSRRSHCAFESAVLPTRLLQRVHVPQVIERFVDGSFGDEGSVGETGIVEQAAKWLRADGSFADVLMAIEL